MSKLPLSGVSQSSLSSSLRPSQMQLRHRSRIKLLSVGIFIAGLAVTLATVWWRHQDTVVSAPPAKGIAVESSEIPPTRTTDDAKGSATIAAVAELLPESIKTLAPTIQGMAPVPYSGTTRSGVVAAESRMDLDEMRKAGRATLQRALAEHRQAPHTLQPMPAPASVSQPLALAPLPTEPPPVIRAAMQPAGAQSDCCPGALPPLPDATKDEDPGNVERRQLAVAAQHGGKGDWQAAHDTYRQLAATTQDEFVRIALRRNLEITEKQLEIQNEPDPARREWLELDLARVHQDLGHSQAAQRMWRDLEKRALHPDVRAQSARLQLDPPKPTRPVTLPTVQPQPEPAQ